MKDLVYPMVFNPGEDWTYAVMDWPGHMVSRLNGSVTLGEYSQERIFGPLGLKDTTFNPLDDPLFNDRLTGTHWRQPDGSLKLADENAGDKYAKSGYHNAGGGLWSTADDLCKLLQGVVLDAELTKILRPESIRDILTPRLADPSHLDNCVAKMTREQDINILPQIPASEPKNLGLGVAIYLFELDTGLSAVSAQWSGFPKSYWVDLTKGVAGVMVASVLKFADQKALKALFRFQKASYGKLENTAK